MVCYQKIFDTWISIINKHVDTPFFSIIITRTAVGHQFLAMILNILVVPCKNHQNDLAQCTLTDFQQSSIAVFQ